MNNGAVYMARKLTSTGEVNTMLPSDYLKYREFNLYNAKYRERSVKKYLTAAYHASYAYEERSGGWNVVKHKVTNFLGYDDIIRTDRNIEIYDKKDDKMKKITPQGYCCWNDELFVVVYCGTNDRKDWFSTNFDTDPIGMPWGGNGGEGFYRYMNSLYPTFKNAFLENGKDKKLVVIGHSLGGIAAVMFAGKLFTETEKMPHNVITFGQPPGMYEDSARYLDKIMGKYIFRFVFSNDMVPRLPKLVYSHLGNKIPISSYGKFFKNRPVRRFWHRLWGRVRGVFKLRLTDPFMAGIRHHDIDSSYIDAVEDYNNVFI